MAWAMLLARMWGSKGLMSTLMPTERTVQIRPTLAMVVSPDLYPRPLASREFVTATCMACEKFTVFIQKEVGMGNEYNDFENVRLNKIFASLRDFVSANLNSFLNTYLLN